MIGFRFSLLKSVIKDIIKRTGEIIHMDFIIENAIATMLNLSDNGIVVYVEECPGSLEAHAKVYRGEMSWCLQLKFKWFSVRKHVLGWNMILPIFNYFGLRETKTNAAKMLTTVKLSEGHMNVCYVISNFL